MTDSEDPNIRGFIYSQAGTIHVATDEWARVEDLSEPRITLCGTHVRNSVFESDRLSPEVYIEDLCDTCEERLLEVTDGDLSRFSYWFIEAVRRRNSAELHTGSEQ